MGGGGRISFRWLWLALLAPFLLAMLLGSLLPSTDFDVNEYHFQGPKEYFQNGRISFLAHNVYTSFPFGTEMLTLLAMVLRGDWYRGALAGKCVLMTFAPLTALALFAAGRRWFSTLAGILAAGLYLTTPWVYRISTIAYAEGGLSFYLFAALCAWMLAADEAAGEARDAPNVASPDVPVQGGLERGCPFFLAGLLAGAAMACKYPGVVSVVIPLFAATCALAFRGSPQSAAAPAAHKPFARFAAPAVFVLGVALTIGPWLLKNLVETGNPVYPLMYTLFDGRDWDAQLNEKWRNGHKPPGYALVGGNPFVDNPTDKSLLYMAVDVAARNDWVNLLLFAFAPLALLRRDARRRAVWLWLSVGYLFLTWWLLTHRIDRFWVPMTPVVALLAGAGAAGLWEAARLRRGAVGITARLAAIGAYGLVLPVNLLICVSPIGGYNEFLLDMAVGTERVAEITAPEIVFLNERLPAGSKVLSVGDAQVFEARFPIVYNTVFDRSIFEEWCAEPVENVSSADKPLRAPEEIRRRLHEAGITHVYVSWRWISLYRSPGNYGYTDFVTPARFAALRRAGILGEPWPIPQAYKNLEEISAGWREEIRRFAPELIVTTPNGEAYTTFQVFDVLPPRS